jgi:hypothetical protein
MRPADLLLVVVIEVVMGLLGWRVGIVRGRPAAGWWLGLLLGTIGVAIIILYPRTSEAKARATARRYAMQQDQEAAKAAGPPRPMVLRREHHATAHRAFGGLLERGGGLLEPVRARHPQREPSPRGGPGQRSGRRPVGPDVDRHQLDATHRTVALARELRIGPPARRASIAAKPGSAASKAASTPARH